MNGRDQWAVSPVQFARRSSERAAAGVHEEMKRGLAGLATVASTAPLVGMFATVLGIFDSPQAVGTEKTTVMAMLFGRLADACVPMEMGLLVGLLSLWGYKYLTGRLRVFDREMENASLELTNQLSILYGRLMQGSNT